MDGLGTFEIPLHRRMILKALLGLHCTGTSYYRPLYITICLIALIFNAGPTFKKDVFMSVLQSLRKKVEGPTKKRVGGTQPQAFKFRVLGF